MDDQMAITKQSGINRRVKMAITCGILMAVIIGVFVAGRFISEESINADFANKNLAPSLEFLFGTDWLGRNMLLRTIKGLSLSIMIGVIASAVSAVLATLIGIAAAIGPKWLDSFISWFIDLMMGIPHLVLLILIAFACGRGMMGLLVGISLTHWTSLARLIRAEVLQLKSQQYITVSRKLGKSSGWILVYHILPHILPQFVIGFVLLFPHAILHESALSFLGYGLPPEQPAVGIILSESMRYLTGGLWWLAVFPGALLVIMALLFDKLGDNLKTLFDPYIAHE